MRVEAIRIYGTETKAARYGAPPDRKLLAGCAVFPALSIVANAKALDAAI